MAEIAQINEGIYQLEYGRGSECHRVNISIF